MAAELASLGFVNERDAEFSASSVRQCSTRCEVRLRRLPCSGSPPPPTLPVMEPKRPRLLPDWMVTPAYGADLTFERIAIDEARCASSARRAGGAPRSRERIANISGSAIGGWWGR